MKKILLTLIPIFCVGSLFAEFQKVDDFENYTVDEQPPAPWAAAFNEAFAQIAPYARVVADPFDANQGNVLAIHPGVPLGTDNLNFGVGYSLPQDQQIVDPIFQSEFTTFYFRIARPLVQGVPGEADMTWGLLPATDSTTMDNLTETSSYNYGAYSVLGRIEANGGIDIHAASETSTTYYNLMDVDAGEAMDTQTYYEIWFVIDHYTNNFQQYIRGGTDYPEQTLVTWGPGFTPPPERMASDVVDTATYRNRSLNPLDTVYFRTSAGNTNTGFKGKDAMYVDDFYIDLTGMNLNSPGVVSGLVVLDFEDDTVGQQPNVDGASFSPSSNTDNNRAVVVDSTSDPANPLEGQSLYIYDGGPDGPTHFRFPIKGGDNLTNIHLSFDFQRAYADEDTNVRVHVALGRAGNSLNSSSNRPFQLRLRNDGNVIIDAEGNSNTTIGPYNTEAANTINVLANSHDTDSLDYNLALGMGTIPPNSLHLFLNGENMGEFSFYESPSPDGVGFYMQDNDLGQFALFQDTNRAGGIVFDNIVLNQLKVDVPPPPTAGKLVNISTRGFVGTGDEVMIGGFILQGGGQQVLIQARGPELANPPFSIANALADPVLTLLDSTGAVLMTNDDWEDSQGEMVNDLWGGTSPLAPGGTSSAIVINLESDANTSYTAQVTGKNGTTGVALVEVYEID